MPWITHIAGNVLRICTVVAREACLLSSVPLLCAFRYAFARESDLTAEPRVPLTVTHCHKLPGMILSLEKCWAYTVACSLPEASSLVRELQVTPTHGTRTGLGWKCSSRMLPHNVTAVENVSMCLCLLFLIFYADCTVGIPLFVLNRRISPPTSIPFSRVGMQSMFCTRLNYWPFRS